MEFQGELSIIGRIGQLGRIRSFESSIPWGDIVRGSSSTGERYRRPQLGYRLLQP